MWSKPLSRKLVNQFSWTWDLLYFRTTAGYIWRSHNHGWGNELLTDDSFSNIGHVARDCILKLRIGFQTALKSFLHLQKIHIHCINLLKTKFIILPLYLLMSRKSSLPINPHVRPPPTSGVSSFHKNPMIWALLQCKHNSGLVIVHRSIKSGLKNLLRLVNSHSLGFCLHWRLSVPCYLPTADKRSSLSSAASLQMWPPFYDGCAAASRAASCRNNIYLVAKETLLDSPFL